MKRIFAILVLTWLAYLVFTTSCANPGMPVGGLKDTIPPVVIKTVPEFNAREYTENTVNLTFNEFVISDQVSENLVISPPLKKKPMIRTKSKTLIVDMGENLKPNTTYSLDFKDAIVDNNEKNPLEDFRFSFSNGASFDSLMIGGFVRNAENMEPLEGILILLHSLDSISAFKDSIPDYIAKTDEEGFFNITNIAAGKYHLYGLDDTDNSLTFNQDGELVAFSDSLVIPTPPITPDIVLADSLQTSKELFKLTQKPYYLLLFQEESFDQYMDNYKRDKANLCHFYFTESLTDSFQVNLLSTEETPNWSYLEYSPKRDTLALWINDTIISKMDTLQLQLKYQVLDSLKSLVMKTDTVELLYTAPVVKEKKKKKAEETEKVIPHFTFKVNTRDGFDVYNKLTIESPEPLAEFDLSKVHLYHMVDTVEETLPVEVHADSTSLRKFYIDYPWMFENQYRVEIDSAAARNYNGQPANKLSQRFKIQKEGYYAKIILTISKLPGDCVVQLLKNTDKEEVVQKTSISADGVIEFPYLKPEKYKIRLIVDRNDNGVWDTGNLEQLKQPERVIYYPKILKLRSNFEVRESWVLPDDLQFKKELIDDDQKEKDAKKAKAKKPMSR